MEQLPLERFVISVSQIFVSPIGLQIHFDYLVTARSAISVQQ